jgi:hypothetical protein
MTSNPSPERGSPVLPLFRCRTCGIPAVRYVGGKRRTFYCAQHGPMKLSDWTRLLPIPEQEYESAGRVLSMAPPLPPRVARLIEGLADGLREVLAQDLPMAEVADESKVRTLEAENGVLRAEVSRLTHELEVATEIASEALELWPKKEETPVIQRDAKLGPVPDLGPEKPIDLTPPPPAPAKPTRGFTVTSPPPKPEETKAVAPPPVSLEDDAALDLFGLEVLIQRIPVTDRSPGLTVTRAALKDFDHLSAHNKQAVLDALALLGPHPETLREDRIFGHTHLVGLRATRRLRVICEKRHGSYAIQRIVDRSDRTFYRSER